MSPLTPDTGTASGDPPPSDYDPASFDLDAMAREGLREPSQPQVNATPADHDGTGRVRLHFTPADKSYAVPPGVTVFDAASWNGIAIDSTCGGHGTCKKCKVQVTAGSVPASRLDARAFSPDQLQAGWRLACRVAAVSDLSIDVPPMQTRPKAATVGVGRQVILRPAVQKRFVRLEEPSLTDQRSDLVRVTDAIDDLEVRPTLHALRRLPRVLREADYAVTAVVVDDVLIDVEPGDTTTARHAVAFDLGTTTVVATLLDLSTGTPAAVASMLNAQQPFGADVISRISATMLDPSALERLQGLARDTLDGLVGEVCADAGIERTSVYEIAVAGNATMTALLLGIDPEALGVAPFVMTAGSFPGLSAAEMGIHVHPAAPAQVFPALGAYVGGDIVAGMLASGMDRDKRLRLFIDVGTNCEIVLADGETILATAAPAGPAFEGGAIRCGMRAAAGAIEVVRIGADDVTVGVISAGDESEAPPVGLCGSGLVDAVAELVRIGLLEVSGRFVPDETAASTHPGLADRLTKVGDERIFVLVWQGEEGDVEHSVYVSQRDIRELQFAKAAIATGWSLLCAELGVSEADVQQVLLAGSFGSYLSPGNAVRIGLVPKLPVLRIVSAGNVAGEGAKMTLLSVPERAGADTLLREVRYVELSDRTDFNDRFVDQLAFPG
ncbi:MAG TPA: ASKHA domain-containing protein [Nocardioidaceae bacterium]|nr:ASKHA domain-containing protein [Nocardioidaceae bacterium]